MGDTFGAWLVVTADGTRCVIVCKAYALAQSIARRRYPGYTELTLASSKSGYGGEVVVVGNDGTERLG